MSLTQIHLSYEFLSDYDRIVHVILDWREHEIIFSAYSRHDKCFL